MHIHFSVGLCLGQLLGDKLLGIMMTSQSHRILAFGVAAEGHSEKRLPICIVISAVRSDSSLLPCEMLG